MLALTLETAKNVGIAIILGLIAVAVLSAWLMKALAMKLITIGACALLAYGVWSNRQSLQECADKVVANPEVAVAGDAECTFWGFTVTIPGISEPESGGAVPNAAVTNGGAPTGAAVPG